MFFSYFVNLAIVACCATASPVANDPYAAPKASMAKVQQNYHTNTMRVIAAKNSTCHNPSIRRAWDDLCDTERKDYLDAVKCLATKPTKLDRAVVPGARDLRDDFTWTHINVTNLIHVSAYMLPWHRHYIWLYEKALQEECGYKGALPYWAYERHADSQKDSPVWSSFGGDGKAIPHGNVTNTYVGLPAPGIEAVREPGTGGGCVQDGPFSKGYQINLGPVSLSTYHNAPNNIYGNQYNPRCLSRDFNQLYSSTYLNYTSVATVLNQPDMASFHNLIEMTLHKGSHTFIGIEAYDFFSSPQDPVFFLLHSQIDRVWSLWQGQDYATRKLAVDGTVTAFNLPPSANGTLDSVMNFEVLDSPKTIGDLASPIENGYCYMYA